MAGILQLRRGLKTTYVSEGSNLAEAFFVTDNNTLIIGTSGSVGSDVTTLAKMSMANQDNTLAEANTGSFWLTGDVTASDSTGNHPTSSMYLNGNITASHAWFKRDVRIDGHLIMGDSQPQDVVTIKSDFSGSIVPDMDNFGTETPVATYAIHDFGTDTKRWRNIYLQRDSATAGLLSGSNIDLTGKIKVDGEGRFGTARIDDLTDNRVLISGVGGEVEDDANLTFDGQNLKLGGAAGLSDDADYYQTGSWQVSGSGEIDTLTVRSLTNDRISFTKSGIFQDSSDLTWDGNHVGITGGISASDNVDVRGQGTFASANVEDLTNDRIVIAGINGEIEDDQYFRYTGNDFIIGSENHFRVTTATGNTFISGAVQMYSTLNVDAQSTLASVNVEDLTNNRVVIVGSGGEIEDDGNFTFDATELSIGTGNFTVQQGSGNTQILGTLDVDSQSTLSSLNVQDLTDNRIVIAGTSGEIEDDANFTFNGTELNIGTGNFTVQQGSGNTQIVGTLNVDAQSTLASVNVEDLTSGRVVLAGTSGEIEDSANLTFDGSQLTVTGDTTITGNLTIQGTQTQLNTATLNVEDINILIASGALDASAANGAGITIDGADATILYSSANNSFQLNKQLQVEGNISGSSFGGTTLLSSSNENFADYSQSVDSRLDSIEGPVSTSLDLRLIEIFSTGSDHETRVDLIEGTMSSSFDVRILESYASASDHETRLDAQELHSSSFTSNDLDMNGNKVLFGNVYSAEGDLPTAASYHGMFAHVHGTGKGYYAHGGNWIKLIDESSSNTGDLSEGSNLYWTEARLSSSLDNRGVISGSSQVNADSITNFDSNVLTYQQSLNVFSGSAQVIDSLPTGTISGSSQLESILPSGTVSGSSQVDVEYSMLDSSFKARASNVTLSSGTTSAIIDFTSSAVFEITTPTDSTATTLNFDNAEIGMSKMVLIVNQGTAGSGTITLGQTTGTGTFIRTSSDDIVRTISTTNYLQITCIAESSNDRTFVYTVGTAQ
jgi:hypothetical protein